MNLQQIKRDMAIVAVECKDENFRSWSFIPNKDCVHRAHRLCQKKWPDAEVQMRVSADEVAINVVFRPLKGIRSNGIHLLLKLEEQDARAVMENASIKWKMVISGIKRKRETWFLDCANVPNPIPEWASRFELTEEDLQRVLK